MKKLCLILLLIPLLLCGCKKEPQDEVQPYYGEFFTQDGIAQNTGVVLVIKNEALVAPVTELSYALYDQVDFGVKVELYGPNNERTHRVDVYRDGAWEEAPWYGGGGTLDQKGMTLGEVDPTYKGTVAISHDNGQMLFIDPELRPKHEDVDFDAIGLTQLDMYPQTYYPLEAGLYRLRVTYRVPDGPEGTADTLYEAVAYFTVTAE